MLITLITGNVALCIGLFMVTCGIVLQVYWINFLEYFIGKHHVLSQSAGWYDHWVKTPVKAYDEIYFFNWTNPSDMKEPGYKPKFEEIGPYTYREVSDRSNIIWNENGTVSYKKITQWFEEPELTEGSFSDMITTLNPVPLSAVYVTRHWSSITRMSLNMAITASESMSVTKTISEMMFDGYSNTMMDAARLLPGLGEVVPFDKFSWFYKMNNTDLLQGSFNIETGSNDLSALGVVRKWNYKDHTGFYPGSCGSVEGADLELYPPNRNKSAELLLFVPTFCRQLRFKYVREETVYGIKGFRYEATDSFANESVDPRHECYCVGDCDYRSGIMNVSACRYNSPAFTSKPHFLHADPWYLNSVDGLKPDFDKHELYIILEPTYGVPLKAAARMQVNLQVRSYPDISLFNGVPTIYFPMFWATRSAKIPIIFAIALKMLLILPDFGQITSIILLIIGPILIVLFIARRSYGKNWSKFLKKHLGLFGMQGAKQSSNCPESDVISPLMVHKTTESSEKATIV